MKVVFANPPVVRYKNFSPENDVRVSDSKILKILSKLKKRKILRKPINYLCRYSGLRFGVGAGCRWPWTTNRPIQALNYPLMMAYAVSYLKSKGIVVNLIDAIAEEQYSYSDFLEEIKKEHPDIAVLECSTSIIDIDLWMAKEISKFTKVALAGSHLALKCDEVKKENPYITYFLKGEYIESSLKMVQTRKPGIYESEVITDLDSIPFPFRDYKSATKYYDATMPTKKPQLQIYSSKGCPFKCSFCLWPQTMYQGKVVLRSPKKIAEEIKECVKKYGYKSIFFDDDTFNLGNERISELCDELKKIGLPWTMMGRIDCSPNWLYDKMVDSGCVGMRFGIETFNLDVLKKINKGIERTDFLGTLKYLSNKYPKLMIHLTMMKDLPGQTEEIYKKDMQILKKLGYKPHRGFPYYTNVTHRYRNYQVSHCVPFPGTKMYEDLIKEKGKDKLKDYRLYDGGQDTIMTKINKGEFCKLKIQSRNKNNGKQKTL